MAYENALAALADPTRRRVFERLRSGPHAVAEIARGMPVSRPAVSQHLKVLKEAGLVADRPEGTRRVYSIDPHPRRAARLARADGRRGGQEDAQGCRWRLAPAIGDLQAKSRVRVRTSATLIQSETIGADHDHRTLC